MAVNYNYEQHTPSFVAHIRLHVELLDGTQFCVDQSRTRIVLVSSR
jgi:hypothetical protein